MKKIEVIAHTAENSTATTMLMQHIFKTKLRGAFYEEKYEGNISLCGRIAISLDGMKYMPIAEIPPEPLDEENLCKNCLRIFRTKTNFELIESNLAIAKTKTT